MDGIGYFLVRSQQVFSVLLYFAPLTLLLSGVWLWAFAATKPTPTGGRRRMLALGCLPPFAFPMAILVCGVVFVSEERLTGESAPAFPGHLIRALVLVQLPLAGLVSWRWGKQWPAVAASWVCAGYLSLAAGFISSMSVTGVWL